MDINLPILETIKDLQTQHGLKYENYRRYRSYCSRRLHRLRRSLNVHQGIASSAKARHQRGRKLLDVNNAMVLEAGEKNPEYAERMLIIPLCLAERAWSYAMQLKQEKNEAPRKRFHLVRRLKKASDHAQRFEKLCHDPESPCTDSTKLEATAYAAYITGAYQVERELWKEAKDNLNKSLDIYFKLSVSIRNDDILEHYRQRIDELRASLRYCTFNLADQDTKNPIKVQLPPTLQFHDLAFKHVKELEKEKESDKNAAVQKAPESVVADEEDDDEFEETQEGVEVENQDDDEDDESRESDNEDDDDDKNGQAGSRVAGVTGLVKNWFGGAWK